MRPLVLGIAAWIGFAVGCSRDGEPVAEPAVSLATRPEIVVLISIDTLRADHLGVYGHERFTSPVLDAFAAQGSVFEDASAPAPWTLPSHASMLTGLYPLGHGVITSKTALPDHVPTLASMLKTAGYETAAVVNSTWLKQTTFGLTRDFDAFLAVDDADYGRRTPSTWVTDQAVQWLRERGNERLFLFIHYYDVHADYASLPAYEKLMVTPYTGQADGTGWQLQRANFDEQHLALCADDFDPEICAFGSQAKPRVIDEHTDPVRFDAADVRHLEELYDAGIRQLDSELGRLFAYLDEEGLSKRSLVIVTSDHGEEFMEHGRVEHFLTTHQEMLHIPLILRGPGAPAGLRVSAPVSIVDLAPTVLSLVGAPVEHALDGLDLSPLLRGGDPRPFVERPLFGEAAGAEGHGEPLRAIYPVYRSVRQGRFKLIQDSLTAESRLYDLESDPTERSDIRSRQPEVAARLEAALEARHREVAAGGADAAPAVLDPEEIDRLRALGYVP